MEETVIEEESPRLFSYKPDRVFPVISPL